MQPVGRAKQDQLRSLLYKSFNVEQKCGKGNFWASLGMAWQPWASWQRLGLGTWRPATLTHSPLTFWLQQLPWGTGWLATVTCKLSSFQAQAPRLTHLTTSHPECRHSSQTQQILSSLLSPHIHSFAHLGRLPHAPRHP